MASDQTDIVALANSATLRREDLYQPACWVCSSHIRPNAVFQHALIRRWLGPYASWKASRSAFHDEHPGGQEVSKRSWQAVRRWAGGAAADFNSVDKLFAQLNHSMSPWDFQPGDLIRRVSFPWNETTYSARISLAWALYNASRVLDGKQPYDDMRAAQQAGEDLPDPLNVGTTGGACPVCGGWGASSSKATTSPERHAATRRRKRAMAKMAMGQPAAAQSQRHEDLSLFPEGDYNEGAGDGCGSGRSGADGGGALSANRLSSNRGDHERNLRSPRLVHPQHGDRGFSQLLLFGGGAR